MMNQFKVLMPAGEIPLRSTVTKATGEKEYTLVDQLVVYAAEGGNRQTIIKPEPGVRYMIDSEGSIVAVPSTKEIMWRCTTSQLTTYLEGDDES
jgi:hypothetical protein